MEENLPYSQIPLVVIDTQCKLSSIYIKEQDILDLVNDKYIINEEETKRIKKNIRNRFNNLIK